MREYCIFSANYIPNIGGVERYTYYLAQNLAGRGNRVTIVTNNVFGLHEIEEKGLVRVVRLPCFPLMRGRFPVPKCGAAFFRIWKRVKERHYDLVIVNTRFYVHSLLGAAMAKGQKTKCITVEHGTTHLTFGNGFLDIVEHVYEHAVTGILRCLCKEYYGVSKACCAWSAHFGIRSRGVLYNAVDVREIEGVLQNIRVPLRKRLGIKEGTVVIAYAGRLVPEKGIRQLLESIKWLDEWGSFEVCLLLAGEGRLYSEVEKSCKENVRLLGRLAFSEVIELLDGTDIFCLPSVSEGFPTTVLEAAACGCFVVTTKTGGARELIVSDEYGMILPDNRAKTLKDALLRASLNPRYRREAAERCRQRLVKEFTWETTTDKVEEIAGENV